MGKRQTNWQIRRILIVGLLFFLASNGQVSALVARHAPFSRPRPAGEYDILSLYFNTPTGPSCVGAGCSSPTGYNTIVNATFNEQSLHAYDPSSKYFTGSGRVETKIRVSGAGIGDVRLYYAYTGVNCNAGYAVYVTKTTGNVNYPSLPLSGYFDVTLASNDRGSFWFYTRCLSGGSYVGNYGIDSLWYSLTCHGSSCNGLNPNTMGCDSDAQTYPVFRSLYVNDTKIGEVQNRYSNACLAQWERTRNLSGNSMYAEGSIRWGGIDYSSDMNPINGYVPGDESVYTAMYATDDGFGPSLNCGDMATSVVYPPPQPINLLSPYGA